MRRLCRLARAASAAMLRNLKSCEGCACCKCCNMYANVRTPANTKKSRNLATSCKLSKAQVANSQCATCNWQSLANVDTCKAADCKLCKLQSCNVSKLLTLQTCICLALVATCATGTLQRYLQLASCTLQCCNSCNSWNCRNSCNSCSSCNNCNG